MCETLGALPEAGAFMDQPVWLLRAYAIQRPAVEPQSNGQDEFLASLPVELF